MSDVRESVQLRGNLVATIKRDLLGPADDDNEFIIDDRPSVRYLVGMLAPAGIEIGEEADDDVALGGEDAESDDGTPEPGPARGNRMFPSSMGLSFRVVMGTPAIHVTAKWGQYVHEPKKEDRKPGWQRIPHVTDAIRIAMKPGRFPLKTGFAGVNVLAVVSLVDGDFAVSVFMVNEQVSPDKNADTAWLFQPELIVESENGSGVFVNRTPSASPHGDNEAAMINLLYRKQVEFAVGHGVAVEAETAKDDVLRAARLKTSVIPSWEVPLAQARHNDQVTLDMKELSEGKASTIRSMLEPLLESYANWIEDQRKRLDQEPDLALHKATSEENLSRCDDALARMRAGAALLENDSEALEAFRFTNRSMWLQRVQSLIALGQRRDGKPPDRNTVDIATNRSWRPFQLAFILLNLCGVTDVHHDDHKLVDLLWFPTGGGKTEAYLGLAAYVMGLRRLRKNFGGRSGEDGVSVLMRYTLRLLTIQQFQRATALICACEMIRRESEDKWGHAPFRIGLWVGSASTPNSVEESHKAVQDIRNDNRPYRGSPAQLATCPWCGLPINPKQHITVHRTKQDCGRTLIHCGDPNGKCPFSRAKSQNEGLPVVVVDEEIYRLLPTLLIATVDKFARMPWKGETQLLFGKTQRFCERHGFLSLDSDHEVNSHQATNRLPVAKVLSVSPLRPPDLIIQDELHLISGPLGTLVGLYETAVDALSQWEVDGKAIRPKVVASTATIRRAQRQAWDVFCRQTLVFPPQGLDAGDSYFAHEEEVNERSPGRLYLGLMAPGRSIKAALIRSYVALLASAQQQFEANPEAGDAYMTLVGYFNSLRELGGMLRLVEDDVQSRLRRADERKLAKRYLPVVRELTSRKDSTEVPRILAELDRKFTLPPPPPKSPRAVDVLLASNMISVGVDVDRLGAMIVNGQPKSTSEYIQATSRVGRSHPGLVLTVYNWARPRDLSHYERFEHYHATLYKHVEAISVTPFAARARDRGMAGVLVALSRLMGADLVENRAAEQVARSHPMVQAAITALCDRAELIGGKPMARLVTDQIDAKLDDWIALAKHGLNYTGEAALLTPADGGRWKSFTCLNSLREVETEAELLLDEKFFEGKATEATEAVAANEGSDAE